MAADKKFGTFGGVFTPSILTILGVIMYLRLPWIVGQAGLYATLGIIIVAHIISVLTGLSVSSIATDKKVKAGGNYFIISRSLGLPIGGTLGIALFAGLSFSISLYVIGFSESFLGFWGFEITKNAIRIAGTLALLTVTTIIFISTSLAIKTQYIIMLAIGMSLISILFGNSNLAPAQPLLSPAAGAAPLMVLFGIFFPAVTGFEAGVSMSGDLRDPKKSIPVGTISAITVGLVTYVGLAVFFAYRVNSDALVNNSSVLLDISFFSPLVIAGIWGATLSSAMGSILGAPRILQATSYDRITPKIFSKGYGKTNEPRNALVLTFLLAETGILIGELNVIARIVSIFFITTYGFLNLSCAIENWASPDFRPSFKTPAWSSILGAIACFFVMLELDVLALIGASIILGGIFLFLKNRELTLESGDTWEGVWSSIIRSGLFRLNRVVRHQRNWRPNVILFSGDSSIRPHLLEFGKWLVHRRGILSNFDLKENPKTEKLVPKMAPEVKEIDEESGGIFTRQMECNDIYDGMDTISRVYGFSGLDPNTILLGWSHNGRDPQHFIRLLSNLRKLDYNILVLNYDRDRGFGNRKQIDIWWRGGSNNATLALVILKFLTATDEWREADARIMIISNNSALNNKIHKNLTHILEDQRIDATVKIINNTIDKRAFPEIIKIESAEADLIMLGMPDFDESNAPKYLQNTRLLVNDLNNVLFLNASSSFEALHIGIEIEMEEEEPVDHKMQQLSPLRLPEQEALAANLEMLDGKIQQTLDEFGQAYLKTIETLNQDLLEDIKKLLERNAESLAKNVDELDTPRFRKLLTRVQTDIFFQSRRILTEFENNDLVAQQENLANGIENISSGLGRIKQDLPAEITLFFDEDQIETEKSDSIRLKILKFRERIRHRWMKKPVSLRLDFNDYVTYLIEDKIMQDLLEFLNRFGISSYEYISDIQKLINTLRDDLNLIESQSRGKKLSEVNLADIGKKLSEKLQDILLQHDQNLQQFYQEFRLAYRAELQDLADHAESLEISSHLRNKYHSGKTTSALRDKIAEIPETWKKNQGLVINFLLADLNMMVFQNRLNIVLTKLKVDLTLSLENNILDIFSNLQTDLNRISDKNEKQLNGETTLSIGKAEDFKPLDLIKELLNDIQSALQDIPETMEIISEEAFQEIEKQQFEQIEINTVSLRRLVSYVIETGLTIPLQEEFRRILRQIDSAWNQVRDVIRLVNFALSTQSDAENTESFEIEKSLQTTIKNAVFRLEKEYKTIEEISEKSLQFIDQKKAAAYEKLNPYLIVRTAKNLGQFVRTHESRKMITQMEGIREQIASSAKNVLVSGVYGQSRGVSLARKISRGEPQHRLMVDRLLSLNETVSPQRDILKSLPLYYRQLFLSKQPITPELWVDRRIETKKAEEVVNRYRNGYAGGLLVSGRPNSGKTAFSQFIARKNFERSKIFQLFPPEGGSTNPNLFRQSLEEAVQFSGEFRDIFASLPVNSVFIFHDLEMWWQRSAGGSAVIEQIETTLNDFSERCFFIINVNFYSYRLIRKISSLDDYFLGSAFCEPFGVDELRRAVLLRHASTGLNISLNESDNAPSNYKLARYFSGLLKYSSGNIGSAFNGWISHIKKFSGNTIVLRRPERPDLSAIEELKDEQILWLVQFVLHKQLTPGKLEEIFKMDTGQVNIQIGNMRRSGLLTERSENVFEINPFLKPFLVEKFVKMEML